MAYTGKELIERFGMTAHVEGGAFRELFRENEQPGPRPAHGVIYYMLDEGDVSDFHVLDADEYWLYHTGSDVELWWIDPQNKLQRTLLGMGPGAQPCALMPGGTVFGAKHASGAEGATLMSCVTAPRFTYEKYRILPKEEVLAMCPEAAAFFG